MDSSWLFASLSATSWDFRQEPSRQASIYKISFSKHLSCALAFHGLRPFPSEVSLCSAKAEPRGLEEIFIQLTAPTSLHRSCYVLLNTCNHFLPSPSHLNSLYRPVLFHTSTLSSYVQGQKRCPPKLLGRMKHFQMWQSEVKTVPGAREPAQWFRVVCALVGIWVQP